MYTTSLLTTLILASAVSPCGASEADPVPVLWHPPGNIELRDWIWGSGGETRAPKPPFEFIGEDSKGTNAKIKVRDARGDHWTVKFGGEIHGDVFASRLVHAMGYVTEPTYFVAGGVITGAHNLHRAKPFLAKDGTFARARFKLSDHKLLAPVADRTWSWNDNPFVGTPQLHGLKILIMLTSNWDAKDARDGDGNNTAVFSNPASPNQHFYTFNDWGATMGKSGGFFARDKWNPAGYREQTKVFARATPGETIDWGYRGKHGSDVTSGISPADIRWLLTYLSRVTDEQLRAGLRASGAAEPDIAVYTQSIRDRISQLQRLAAPAEAPPTAAAAWARPLAGLFP